MQFAGQIQIAHVTVKVPRIVVKLKKSINF